MQYIFPVHSRKKEYLNSMKIAALFVVLIIFVIVIILGYTLNWNWTGFGGYIPPNPEYQREKTLWDWLQLLGVLAIPVVVGFGTIWFTKRQARERAAENTDNQRENLLQEYIDKMSELLLEKNFRESAEYDEIRNIARVRTLTVLRKLDPSRRASILRFLYESSLIDKNKHMIDLSGACLDNTDLNYIHLREANLSNAHLSEAFLIRANLVGANLVGALLSHAEFLGANLSNANLSRAFLYRAKLLGANLSGANLNGVILSGANLNSVILSNADLRDADLHDADLSYADLSYAIVTQEQLEKAKCLKNTVMPDKEMHA